VIYAGVDLFFTKGPIQSTFFKFCRGGTEKRTKNIKMEIEKREKLEFLALVKFTGLRENIFA